MTLFCVQPIDLDRMAWLCFMWLVDPVTDQFAWAHLLRYAVSYVWVSVNIRYWAKIRSKYILITVFRICRLLRTFAHSIRSSKTTSKSNRRLSVSSDVSVSCTSFRAASNLDHLCLSPNSHPILLATSLASTQFTFNFSVNQVVQRIKGFWFNFIVVLHPK